MQHICVHSLQSGLALQCGPGLEKSSELPVLWPLEINAGAHGGHEQEISSFSCNTVLNWQNRVFLKGVMSSKDFCSDAQINMVPSLLTQCLIMSCHTFDKNLNMQNKHKCFTSSLNKSFVWLIWLNHLCFPANDLERDADIPTTLVTHVEQVMPVTPIAPAVTEPAAPKQATQTPATPGANQLNDRNQNGAGARPETNGTVPGIPNNSGRPFNTSALSSPSGSAAPFRIPPYADTGPLRFLCASDARADVFVGSFMFWMDTVEMVRVAGHPLVFYSGWVFPIYIFSYLSCLRVVVMPHSPLLSSLGVVVQDLPFFFVRVGLTAFFGFVTPVLYLMKNLLVCLAFVYFNFMTKLRVFNTERMVFREQQFVLWWTGNSCCYKFC